MKTRSTFTNCLMTAAFILTFLHSANGQLRLKIKGGSITRGIEQDMVFGLNADYFEQLSSRSFANQMSEAGVQDVYYHSGICENMHYTANLLLAPTTGSNTEVRLSMSYIPNRVDMLSYYNNDNYVNVSSYNDELSVGVSYLKHVTLGKTLRFYGGLGTNIGLIYNHRLYLDGDLTMNTDDVGILNTGSDAIPEFDQNDGFVFESESGPTGISQRIFLQGGMAIRIANRVELGVNMNYGFGYRHFNGGLTRGTNLIGGGLSLGYSIEE